MAMLSEVSRIMFLRGSGAISEAGVVTGIGFLGASHCL